MTKSVRISTDSHNTAKSLAESRGMKLYRLIEEAIRAFDAKQPDRAGKPAGRTRKAG
ncbi:MAG: hypothetical protein ABII12_03250 [Planctomycetota bacterium]